MYRAVALRLPCSACGVERPRAALSLAPRGGYVCWRCDVGDQIATHTALARRSVDWFGALMYGLAMLVGAVVLFGPIVLLGGTLWLVLAMVVAAAFARR